MVARSKNVPAGIASSVTVSWWASSAMSGQYSSRLGSDGAAMASVTGLPSAPVRSSAKRASSEVTLTPSESVTRTGGPDKQNSDITEPSRITDHGSREPRPAGLN